MPMRQWLRADGTSPPEQPRQDVWINTTACANGFRAYVALTPAERLGVAVLTNRNHPMDAPVTAAHRTLCINPIAESLATRPRTATAGAQDALTAAHKTP